jgi:DNA-binding XRE family transcriptional regulator
MITRIRELLEARQLSPTQFADLIGVGRPVISHILSERNKPSLEVVQKIVGAFPEISLPWLLAGTGPMLAAAVAVPSVAPPAATEVPQPPTPVVPVAVPAPAASVPATTPLPPPVVPVTRPIAPARSVAQPSSYPQPPRFRPGVAAPLSPARIEVAPLPTEAPTAPANTATVTSALPSLGSSATPAPVTMGVDYALGASGQVPSPPPPTMPASPIAYESADASSLASPAAEASASSPSSELAPSPNPAAALSFLGEPGKAIRRIVIFYRDGSFSDYLPEGN